MKQRRIDDVAVADHPADVASAPPDFARLDAVEIEHRPFQRDQMPAIVAHHAFRFSGRARGVENVERIGRQHRHARRGFLRGDGFAAQFGPVVIAACDEIASLLRPLQDDAGIGLDAGEFDRLVEQRLVLHEAAGLEPAARREDQLRFCIFDAGGEFLRGKTAEHHRMHRADPRAGQHRDHRFRHHRHIENDAVALGDAEILHDGGERLHLGQQFGIGEFGDGARSGRICQRRIVDQRHLIGAAVRDVAVQRVVAGVDHGAREPAAIEAHPRIEDFFRRLDPVDLARRLAPKTFAGRQASAHGLRGSGSCRGCSWRVSRGALLVMPGLVPGIHVYLSGSKTWMAGTSPAMTVRANADCPMARMPAVIQRSAPNAGTVAIDSGPAPTGASRNDGAQYPSTPVSAFSRASIATRRS